jgi:Flp pilus assembly protein TadG
MMRRCFSLLRRDARGIAAVEFGLLVPIFLAMVIGATQVGVLFFAHAGLRNAVGEAARYATIWPRPTDAQIKAYLQTRKFGLVAANLGTPTITTGTDSSATYLNITLTYNVPLNFIFYRPPAVTLTETRRVYVQAQVAS